MRGIFTVLLVICAILAVSNLYSQSNHHSSQSYSGTVLTFSNAPAMNNRSADIKFATNSNFNESSEKGSYNVYFSYTGNFGKIKPGTYKIMVLKHIGSRMKEMKYKFVVNNETTYFYNILALRKGIYSIRVYDENDVLLGHSDYFNVTTTVLHPEYAKK